ncbi:MAG TPA: DUF6265 family protein [Flavobacterium sp.]|nr:DUF6265 family protein [Flavobacterium sp.]
MRIAFHYNKNNIKKILILLTSTLIFSCNKNTKTNQTESAATNPDTTEIAENMDWLVGEWKRTNDQPEKEAFEIWAKINPDEYSGLGYTMQKEDTIFQEKMTLLKSEGKWHFVVKMPNETETTEFQITELNNKEFTCENDTNDFPKKIQYWKEDEKLIAKISNEDMEILFEFERIKR